MLSPKSGIAILAFLLPSFATFRVLHSPKHWLRGVAFAKVRIDDCPVSAEVYFGHPNRTKAVALVNVPGMGNYFLDFEQDRYREASDYEYIRFRQAVRTFNSMGDERFVAPLPAGELNDFSINSPNGHFIRLQL